MSEIALVTFHRACNYGAFLQAYALLETLNEYPDVNAYIFDYRSNVVEGRYLPNFYLKKKGNPIKKISKYLLEYRDIISRNRIFDEARDKYFRYRTKNLTKSQIKKASSDYDAFISGSDQVWNREIINDDSTYFLDFVTPPILKFSYAASIGKSELTKDELSDITEMLSDYIRISVREDDVIPQLEQCLNNDIICSLDPVFLLDSNQWRDFSEYKERKPYILFFMMGQSANSLPAMEFAKKLAQEKNLDIVYLSDSERRYKFKDLNHFGVASPSEFVGLINNAQCVVTNSFHATAFSIILHKEFFVETQVLRNNRILNLLQIVSLEDRGLIKGKKSDKVNAINWEKVDNNLAPLIEKSHGYLDKIVSDLE